MWSMLSKTRLNSLVRSFQWKAVRDGLTEQPHLLAFHDDRGRSWLHICCSATARSPQQARDSIRTADVLLDADLDIDEPAFTEDAWRATPLWYAVGRGKNLVLAEHLLRRGCNPNFSLWAACYNNGLEAIRVLVRSARSSLAFVARPGLAR